MTEVTRLIQELCPNGVEYKKLGEVGNVVSGYGFPVEYQGKLHGLYPFYKVKDMTLSGNSVSMYNAMNYVDDNDLLKIGCKTVSSGAVIFPKIGAAVSTNKKRILSVESVFDNNIMAIIADDSILNNKYLYYFMLCIDLMCLANQSGAVPSIRKSSVENFEIPVPPLEVQKAIVQELDAVHELERELERELELRREQLDTLRDYLFDFDAAFAGESTSYWHRFVREHCAEGVEWKKLGEVYTRLKGTSITAIKMKEIANDDGGVSIFAGGKTMVCANECDIPNANIVKVPAVLVQSRGVIDFVYCDTPFTFKNEMWAYTADEQVSVRYLMYCLKTSVGYFRSVASSMGSLPQISLRVTENFKIPVPPLSVQKKLVEILDSHVDMTQDLQQEIDLRREQLEALRDKRLSFEAVA